MSVRIDRRGLLTGAAGCVACALAGGSAAAASEVPVLAATTRVLDVGGRPATVLGLLREDGGSGLVLEPGRRFRVRLQNGLGAGTVVHWHGQRPPIAQDGVPDNPLPLLAPSESRSFDFAPVPGTHWMHAHLPDQEMRLLAAPLIVRTGEDAATDRQEVVVMLHDFSFTPLPELLARLGAGAMGGMAHSAAAAPAAGHGGHDMAGMGPDAGAMDLNDIEFDAYLANERTLADPEVVPVERGGRVLLRIINGAGATVF
jgi:FtsP/CotA-like multicopper oxidase with cupredoxin domain